VSARSILQAVATGALVFTLPAVAQKPPPAGPDLTPITAESSYGVEDQQISVIGFAEMLPDYSQNGAYTTDLTGLRYPTESAGLLRASINAYLPNGARLDSMCLYGHDGNGFFDNYMILRLERHFVNASDGSDPQSGTLAQVSSTGNDGNGVWCINDLDEPIIYRYDFDDGGAPEVFSYSLTVNIASDVQGSLGFRMARLAWRRVVRQPPAVATFDDVQLGNPYRRYVEALVGAGIAEPCRTDHFCPDAPITRAQFALYLSRALGLDWPAFGIGFVP